MTLLEMGLDELDIKYDDVIIKKFEKYYFEISEWNSFMNLTSISEYNEFVIKHYLDSLSIVNVFPEIKNQDYKVLDMGSGAGFPGIPLKIVFNNLNLVLMDSINKKVNFLNHAIKELSLEKIYAVQQRAEEAARKEEYHEKYDICVSRAVAKLSTLSEFCIPYVKIGGYFISYKSGKAEDEIKEAERSIEILGGRLIKYKKFLLPNTDIERILVLIKKEKHTPYCYPRAGGKPVNLPL